MIALRSALFNIAFLGWSALLSIMTIPVSLLMPRPEAIHGIGRIWGRSTFALLRLLCGVKYRIVGLDRVPDGPCIIAAKHQSAWDTMIFEVLFDGPSYVLKKELTEIPVFGRAIQVAGNVVVDRKAGSKALKAMIADARQAVDAGRRIVIFPEGTRTRPGEHRRYHPGVAALYRELGIPVVPVALNSGLFWGRRRFLKHPGTIQLEFLTPIEPGLDRRPFMERLAQEIEGASDRLRAAAPGLPPLSQSVEKPVDNSVDKPVGN